MLLAISPLAFFLFSRPFSYLTCQQARGDYRHRRGRERHKTYAPREVSDRDKEKGVSAVENTGKGVVPGSKGGEDAEDTASLDAGGVGGVVDGLEIADTKQEECQIKHEKEEEKGDGGAQGTDEHEEGKDEPALEWASAGNTARAKKNDH